MARCRVCGNDSPYISKALGVCAACVVGRFELCREAIAEAHVRSRQRFGLPGSIPNEVGGRRCNLCSNYCQLLPGQPGYCGIVRFGRDASAGRGLVSWYLDPLPTNCVADWVCPGGTGCGYPDFACSKGPEFGHTNLAVFFEACSFDCLFCQNWQHKRSAGQKPSKSPEQLVSSLRENTSCICYFGGDPSPQMPFSIVASRLARQSRKGEVLRVCWETNGSMNPAILKTALQIALESGGCIKFDLKCVTLQLSLALCGVSNEQTLSNFRLAAGLFEKRPEPPLVVASTLLVPGYVGHEEVGRIASFIASCNPNIPYSLLAFFPTFEMSDLPLVTNAEAKLCLQAAESAGLRRVRIGNPHLLA